MAKKFQVHIEAERFIHNDLSNCAWGMREDMRKKFDSGETEGVHFDMMGALVFLAFSIEAKINFIGWKILEDGWPERANLKEKIHLIYKVLDIEADWSCRPLQSILSLKRFRDTIAHGKPELVKEVKEVDIDPDIWDSLKGQWEREVNPENVNRCYEDIDQLWKLLLEKAGIPVEKTLTNGNQTLSSLVGE